MKKPINHSRLPTRNSINDMKRIPIFNEDAIHAHELSGLLIKDKNNEQGETKINKEKVEQILKPVIKERLKKIFLKKNWDFEKLNGKIYYEVLGKTIEIQVEWKNHFFGSNADFYDRFTLKFL